MQHALPASAQYNYRRLPQHNIATVAVQHNIATVAPPAQYSHRIATVIHPGCGCFSVPKKLCNSHRFTPLEDYSRGELINQLIN